MIQYGKQDIMFAGGCEELDWTLSVLFDAMGAMSSKYNDTPATASRAYDKNRDGFVIAGGAGTVVLEELDLTHLTSARGVQTGAGSVPRASATMALVSGVTWATMADDTVGTVECSTCIAPAASMPRAWMNSGAATVALDSVTL